MYRVSTDRIRDVLARAEVRRRDVLSSRTVDAWRWINGVGDGAPPGLTIDRYASFLVVGAREHLGEEVPRAWARAAVEHARSTDARSEVGASAGAAGARSDVGTNAAAV